jgi:hypothetical protein
LFQKAGDFFKPKFISLRFVKRVATEYGTNYELVSSKELELQPKGAES